MFYHLLDNTSFHHPKYYSRHKSNPLNLLYPLGDDYGVSTDVPWAMTFPIGTPPTTVPVHPTQIYETLLGFGIFVILWKLRGKLKPTGSLFSLYLILAGLERFSIEFIRTNTHYFFSLSGAQIISILMILLGTIMILRLRQASGEKASLESSP